MHHIRSMTIARVTRVPSSRLGPVPSSVHRTNKKSTPKVLPNQNSLPCMINPVTFYGHAISSKPRVTQFRIISYIKTIWALSPSKRMVASPAPIELNTSKQNTSSSNITLMLVKSTFVTVQQSKCGPMSSQNPYKVLNFVRCVLFSWIVPLTIPKILLSSTRYQSNLHQSFRWSPESNWSGLHRGSVLRVHLLHPNPPRPNLAGKIFSSLADLLRRRRSRGLTSHFTLPVPRRHVRTTSCVLDSSQSRSRIDLS